MDTDSDEDMDEDIDDEDKAQIMAEGRLEEAEPLYRVTLESKREALGDRHPSTLTSIINLAFLLRTQGAYKEAEALLSEIEAWGP